MLDTHIQTISQALSLKPQQLQRWRREVIRLEPNRLATEEVRESEGVRLPGGLQGRIWPSRLRRH